MVASCHRGMRLVVRNAIVPALEQAVRPSPATDSVSAVTPETVMITSGRIQLANTRAALQGHRGRLSPRSPVEPHVRDGYGTSGSFEMTARRDLFHRTSGRG